MPYDSYPDERGLRYPLAFLYSLVIALFWIPAALVRRISRWYGEVGTESWPRANGSISAVKVKVIRGWIMDYALGQMDYSYRVSGEYYSGRITRQYPDEQAAWDFVDARRGKAVVVRYRDNDAESCAVRNGDQDLYWTSLAEPGLLTLLWRHWKDEIRGPSAGTQVDVSVEDEDGEDPPAPVRRGP